MAGFRKLPSGKWQATVYVPVKGASGRRKRLTKTHPLKSVVAEWAKTQEAAASAGGWVSPRRAEMTLAEFRAAWAATHLVETSTRKKNESVWSNHVEPMWGGYPLSGIGRPALKEWVRSMNEDACAKCRQLPGVTAKGVLRPHKRLSGVRCTGAGSEPGLGAWTIQAAVSHLSGLLSAAVEEGVLQGNPATGLRLPTIAPKPPFWWTRDEAALILLQLGGADALLVDLGMHVGFRPGELFGLKGQFVDMVTWQIHVHGVATRSGWRAYAKTRLSHRATPVPVHLREALAAHMMGVGPDDLVFPAPEGGPWNDRNFAQRLFGPAIRAAGVRRGTPYDMRHTAASWLVQAGVPLTKVQALLGHEKYSTTLRYAHLAPGQFDAVLGAWGAAAVDPRAASVPHGLGAGERGTGP